MRLLARPFAPENARVVVTPVCVNFPRAAGLVRRLAARYPILVAPKIFEDFARVDGLAVVGQDAGFACVVGAADGHDGFSGWLHKTPLRGFRPLRAHQLCFRPLQW